MFFYDYLLIIIGFTSLMSLLIYLFFERAIDVIYDHQGDLSFKVYQIGVTGFLVKGFSGYPRKARFKSYVDVVAYIDKQINGWI